MGDISLPLSRIALLIYPLGWCLQIFWLECFWGSINISILYTDIDLMGLHGAKCQGYLKKNVELETSNWWSLLLKSWLARIHPLHRGDKWSRRLLSHTPYCLIAIVISHWFESSGRGQRVLAGSPMETKLPIIIKEGCTIEGRGQTGKSYSINEKHPFRELVHWDPRLIAWDL